MSKTAEAGAKAEFCSTAFDWPYEVLWLDTRGQIAIDDDRRAVLELSTWGYGDHYQGFLVSIVSKTHGQIDKKMLLFDDYLPRDERSDSRQVAVQSYPVSPGNPCFQVISHTGWGWYIAVPRTTQPFVDAVSAYIEAWR